MRKIVTFIFVAYCSAGSAALATFTESPTNWDVDITGSVNAYNTGTNCPGGRMRIDSVLGPENVDRLLSLLLFAKATNKKVTIQYDTILDDCPVVNFKLKGA